MKTQQSLEKNILLFDSRALSPIFATLILVAIVISLGSVAYYYVNNITTASANDLVSSISGSQQSISERVGFQDVYYTSSDTSYPNPRPATLTVFIINCGKTTLNVQAILLSVYNTNHRLVYSQSYVITPGDHSDATPGIGMTNLNGISSIAPLRPGEEGYFVVKNVPTSLTTGLYAINLVTKSGSSFEYAP